MIESSEVLVIVAFAVLSVTLIVLLIVVREQSQRLHESVSGSNLAPLYQALLPVAAKYGSAALDNIGDALEARAEATPNKVDDEFARQVTVRLDEIARQIDKAAFVQTTTVDKVKVEPLDA